MLLCFQSCISFVTLHGSILVHMLLTIVNSSNIKITRIMIYKKDSNRIRSSYRKEIDSSLKNQDTTTTTTTTTTITKVGRIDKKLSYI